MLWLLLLQVLASCLWLGHSEVVTSFASCPQFFDRNTTPDNALQPANPAWICQHYNNQYHFATLYDKTLRIPVYSAYIYQPGPGTRSKSWFVEPQNHRIIEWFVLEGTLKTISILKSISSSISILSTPCTGQATCHETSMLQTCPTWPYIPRPWTQDTCKIFDFVDNNLQGLDRGHLSPSDHQSGNNSKWATFTLSSIVPQNSTLNKGAWKDYENKTVAKNSQGCTTTYVIVGAVPGNTYIANRRVDVPSYIWSAACCQTSINMKTWAVTAENNKNQVQNPALAQLEANLSQLYGRKKVSLFHSACPR